jgi:hypothetical protein
VTGQRSADRKSDFLVNKFLRHGLSRPIRTRNTFASRQICPSTRVPATINFSRYIIIN